MKKVTKCGVCQKLRNESKKVHRQNVYKIQIHIHSPKLSQIGLQANFFFQKRGWPPYKSDILGIILKI